MAKKEEEEEGYEERPSQSTLGKLDEDDDCSAGEEEFYDSAKWDDFENRAVPVEKKYPSVWDKEWHPRVKAVGLVNELRYGPRCDARYYGWPCRLARTCGRFARNNLQTAAEKDKLVVNGADSLNDEWPSFV